MLSKNSENEDDLLQMIQQMGRAVARLREMLTSSAEAGPTVRAEVAQRVGILVGGDANMLRLLDADSAVRIVGRRVRVDLWAELLEVESAAWLQEGSVERAAGLNARATALRAAAERLAE